MSDALALFAKAPIPGRVKTRLQPTLCPQQSAELQHALVRDSWEKVQCLEAVAICLYSDVEWPGFVEFVGAERVRLQRGCDLGEKMFHCFEELHQRGHDRIVIIGSDSPTLPTEHIERAFDALHETDAVLGPAEDGGYYAVGCRRPRADMFEDVAWSSGETLIQTEAAFLRVGLRSLRLPLWYDVDTVRDLARLADDPLLRGHTKDWLERNAALVEAFSAGG